MEKEHVAGRSLAQWLSVACLAFALTFMTAPELEAQFGPESRVTGIRVTLSDVRPEELEADIDLTAYSDFSTYFTGEGPGPGRGERGGRDRGDGVVKPGAGVEGPALDEGLFLPPLYAGVPYFGLPAIDYGDGDTVPYIPLVLTSTSGGPGGSSVYRSLTTFTHTYPGPGSYTLATHLPCFVCVRGAVSYFATTNTSTPTYAYTFDAVPTYVIGDLTATYTYQGTTTSPFFSSYILRYATTYYAAIRNTTQLNFLGDPILDVPAASTVGLTVLGLLLALTGVFVLRRI